MVIAMTTAIASSSLVQLHPCLRRVEGRGRGTSHSNDKEEKEGRWPSHIVVVALPTLPPPVGWGCHKPSKDCCQCSERHVFWQQGGGGSNGGSGIERYNNDNDDIGLNAAAGEVVNNVPARQGYDGQQ
jgi:hypothetical protein